MNIHEYQAKELLAKYGIGIPAGHAALTVEEAVEGAKKLPGPLYVVKAQIHAGGRGKGKFKELGPDAKGGVRLAKSIEEVEEAARARFRNIAVPYNDHLGAIEAFGEENDLVEMNVAGAFNSNFMFMRGLVQSGAFDMSEGDILSDIWSQEAETRADSHEWVYAFLSMAYQPLSAAEIEAYVDLSRTAEGAAMNRALFAGFDRMYGAISLSLGVALARQLQGETL